MDAISYKTKFTSAAQADKKWYLIDAENQVVGRLASQVAMILRGKHKTSYTPHDDAGDNVIIINAEKVRFTGNKAETKEYKRYTGYPGGQRIATPKTLLKNKPTEILHLAIHGMLPKGRLGRQLNTNVFIYAGTEHKHEAQQPIKLDINTIKA
ncbi:MAG TPA: 50S ribosomal protein L13 [Bacteroidia bacterium]|nr:50S ribosomal protein L13 [Bacteroidia bacterium]